MPRIASLLLESLRRPSSARVVEGEAAGVGEIDAAAVSASEAQFQALWGIRENASEAQAAEGAGIKHDVAVSISAVDAFIDSASRRMSQTFPGLRLAVFGHLGDGNIHFNVLPGERVEDEARRAALRALEPEVNRLVHDTVVEHGGSISAEHGLGSLRRDEAAHYKSDVELDLMRSVKRALDPRNLMNPGRVLVMP